MTQERALEINKWLLDHALARFDLVEKLEPMPDDLTLADMLEATRIVTTAINRLEGATVLHMYCDPRLIAAIYVAYRYDPSVDPIVVSANGRSVFVLDPSLIKS